jgi:hypothetical protein
MFTFTEQIQAATDTARRGTDRLADKEATSADDPAATIDGLSERVKATIEHVSACDRPAIDASLDRKFKVNMGVELDFTGRTYALGFALPNFLFHVTTAYDILRHKGVELGKREYIAPFLMG